MVDDSFRQAMALLQAGRLDDAERAFKALLQVQPTHLGALNLLAIVLSERRKYAEAEQYLRRALAQSDASDATHYNYGIVLKALRRPFEALERFNESLARNPAPAETWNNRGTVHNDLQRYEDAIADFNHALALRPQYAEAHYNKGKSLAELHRHGEALAAYDRAVALKPDFAEAWLGRGNVFSTLRRAEDALPAYERALALKPDLPYVAGLRLFAKQSMCLWDNLAAERAQVLDGVRRGASVIQPFEFLAVPSSPAEQLRCAQRYVADQHPAVPQRSAPGRRAPHDRIRLAYLSADFHEHATAYLAAGLFELHDRTRFEVTGISYGPDRQDPMRQRLQGAFDRLVDVCRMSDGEVAALLRELEIDIAIDLKGHTEGSRPGIHALRPAPLQVSYLGFPGTLGADYFDYIVADRIVIPPEHRPHFAEAVVELPECYQVNDARRAIAGAVPDRAECGLPETGFVFCCFNSSFKITPEVFDVWMRLLRQVEDSVLWLFQGSATAPVHLRREAERRGIAPARLVFAPQVALGEHLARHRWADLFLDTLPYNAHTTASDALWSGVPVVTCLGESFAGRVAASLLHAIGLPELVTRSLADYEALALRLAREPVMLAALRAKLAHNRESQPLFRTDRFTRHLEAAYETMWQRHQRGDRPEAFTVEAID